MQMFVKECGPMGTGSNMFRSALRASDGTVYIGTYGPAPAIIWRYTKDERLEKVAEVEEYQLDCMVDVPFPVSWTVKMKKKQKEIGRAHV